MEFEVGRDVAASGSCVMHMVTVTDAAAAAKRSNDLSAMLDATVHDNATMDGMRG
jgi:hypothetical protein